MCTNTARATKPTRLWSRVMDRLIANDANHQEERGLSTGPATASNSSLNQNGFVNNGTTADMDDDLSDSGIGKADELSKTDISKIPRIPGDGAQAEDVPGDFCTAVKLQTSPFEQDVIKPANGTELVDRRGEQSAPEPASDEPPPFGNETYAAFKRGTVMKASKISHHSEYSRSPAQAHPCRGLDHPSVTRHSRDCPGHHLVHMLYHRQSRNLPARLLAMLRQQLPSLGSYLHMAPA
ncbi:uncharacterized protein LOC132263847 [Phlebotomus argentipes]|uniref:uncharacterized protein LOC132263847 n=1 Tax=Phlebotomus argentipes TaxID=94469 RepID=UPI0028933BD6|nr:uncharacterized protein LOC132263847 [Phlebotomus argentipes]